jgi:hypothetical protein
MMALSQQHCDTKERLQRDRWRLCHTQATDKSSGCSAHDRQHSAAQQRNVTQIISSQS